jgi:type I restriction enzyme R subunit
MHGLIQAFSRTNRILNSVKTFGNIVCFRNLQKQVDEAIALFGDKDAGGVVLIRKFKDYYEGFDEGGRHYDGYTELIDKLVKGFPLDEPAIIGEARQKAFIRLFGAILRMRNLLSAFDEFAGQELLPERDFQNYASRYQDLQDIWKREKKDKKDISDDLVFETELIRQIEINIDYILMLVQKYHDQNGADKEILVTIQNAVDASPTLRSKKALIEQFIDQLGETDKDVADAWQRFVSAHIREDMDALILAERLKPEPAKRFMAEAFREGEIKETGTAIDRMMPPVSRFGHSGRGEKKQRILDALRDFFDKYSGIVNAEGQDGGPFAYGVPETQDTPLAAEEKAVLEVVKRK